MFVKILFIITLTALAAAESEPTWLEILEECTFENGVVSGMDKAEQAKLQGCVLACAMKRLGTMKENEHWNPERKIAWIPKEHPKYDDIVPAVKQCGELIRKTDCETAELVQKCLENELPCRPDECKLTSFLFMF